MARRVVLVHGAWHGAWAWDPVLPALRARGLDPVAVDLPSARGAGDLGADVATVREALFASDDPTVLVGHSYGGVVISEAGAGVPQVTGLVYVCAFLLDAGQSLGGRLAGVPLPWQRIDHERGLIRVQDPVPLFYADVEPGQAARAAGRLGPQTVASFAQPQAAAAWRDVPSLYVVCSGDRALPPDLQRAMAGRATRTVELATGHSPFLARPEALADVVAGAVRAPVVD